MTGPVDHPLLRARRCGLASLEDVESPEWRGVFAELESVQASFLAVEDRFRSPDYRWPRDPLHNWSRVWEYPYAYTHVRGIFRGRAGSEPIAVADVGSGVTFFPFALARLGCVVTCTDPAEACALELGRAIEHVRAGPGSVGFRGTDGRTLPFEDSSLDVIVCLSVLEHVPWATALLEEMARVLRPRGILVLTFDVDLRGDEALGPHEYATLRQDLRERFVLRFPEVTVHPLDLLHSATGPYALRRVRGLRLLPWVLKQHVLKPILKRRPARRVPFHLTVWGGVLGKEALEEPGHNRGTRAP